MHRKAVHDILTWLNYTHFQLKVKLKQKRSRLGTIPKNEWRHVMRSLQLIHILSTINGLLTNKRSTIGEINSKSMLVRDINGDFWTNQVKNEYQ